MGTNPWLSLCWTGTDLQQSAGARIAASWREGMCLHVPSRGGRVFQISGPEIFYTTKWTAGVVD